MKRLYGSKRIIFALLVAGVYYGTCFAQATGYITGSSSLTSFDVSTVAIINTFITGGDDTQFAVASDDSRQCRKQPRL